MEVMIAKWEKFTDLIDVLAILRLNSGQRKDFTDFCNMWG